MCHTAFMLTTETAGGVVLNLLYEVVVVNQNGDSWSLPKGHIDPDETPEEAAAREITEETGIEEVRLVRPLGSYERYRIGKGGKDENMGELKRITMFQFTTMQEALAPQDPANPVAKWVPIDEVAAILTHPKDKEFFLSIKDSLK